MCDLSLLLPSNLSSTSAVPTVPILTSVNRLSGPAAMINWIPLTQDEARGLLTSLEIAYEPVRESDCSHYNFMDREIVLVRENLFEQNTANITGLEPNHDTSGGERADSATVSKASM